MSDRAPYSRVYWSIVDDPKFVEVYDDDRRLATWLRLLLIADQAHPASPHVPAGVHRPSLKKLVECELVDLSPHGARYRIRGLDKERARRWGARGGNPDGPDVGPEPAPNGTPKGPKPDPSAPSHAGDTRDETRRDETSKDETSTAREVGLSEDEGRVFAFVARFGASVREDSPLGRRLVGLIERRGVEDVLRVAGAMAKANGTMSDRQWVLGLENAIEAIPTSKEGRTIDVEQEREKRAGRVQDEMYARRVERFRFTGEWDEAFGPRPAA